MADQRSGDPSQRQRRGEYLGRIQRVMEFIQVHLSQELNLDDLARVACFSPFHFHRIFGLSDRMSGAQQANTAGASVRFRIGVGVNAVNRVGGKPSPKLIMCPVCHHCDSDGRTAIRKVIIDHRRDPGMWNGDANRFLDSASSSIHADRRIDCIARILRWGRCWRITTLRVFSSPYSTLMVSSPSCTCTSRVPVGPGPTLDRAPGNLKIGGP